MSMNRVSRYILCVLLPILFLPSHYSKAQSVDHEAMPMMVPPTQSNTDEEPLVQKRSLETDEFQRAYLRRGSPRVALWWGQKLDGGTNSQLLIESLAVSGDSFGAFSTESSVLLASETESKTISDESLIVQSTFAEYLIQHGMKIIDKDGTQRLFAVAESLHSSHPDASIQEYLESGSLLEFADYVLQVATLNTAELRQGFLVSLLDLKTGQLITQFSSEGNSLKVVEKEPFQWLPSDTGYEKKSTTGIDWQQAEIGTIDELQATGRSLGYDLVSRLLLAWGDE